MHESIIPVGPPKKRKSPRPRRNHQNEAGPSTSSTSETNDGIENHVESKLATNVETKRIPMLIRGIGVHQVIPKEATRDVLTGKVPFYLVDDRDGVTLFPAKHNLVALKLDQEHVEKLEDYSCIGGHERRLKERPRRREGLGYRRRYISPELLNRGIYSQKGTIRFENITGYKLNEQDAGDLKKN